MGITMPIAAALVSVYIFWGGTYLAMKFAIETMPPFIMAGIRFITAGALVYLWQLAKGVEKPRLVQWKNASIIGGLLLLGGNGGVVWAEQIVPSGVAAIIVATVPLWMALLGWLWPGGRRPSGLVSLGLVLGFIGITLLVNSSEVEVANASSHWAGYIILLAASISWAAGSLYSRVAKLPSEPLMSISLQMLSGGLLCLMVGLLSGEWTQIDLRNISTRSVLSLSYLIIFGSIIGFSAYIWLLKVANPTLVSTYAYINPIVAVILGWALADERMTTKDGMAGFVIVLAVIIMTRANSRQHSIQSNQSGIEVEGS